MKYSEFETMQHLNEQLSSMKLLLSISKELRVKGLSIKVISDLEDKVKKLELDLKESVEIPQQFNEYFSERGWISYHSLNQEVMKNAIQTYQEKGLDEAEKILLEYYQPENLHYDFIRLKALSSFLKRYKFIEYAINDYKEGKYYSTIPLLIMIIDGSVNEIVGKGFHSEKSDIDVWDSITNIDNGILKIRDIFRKGRNKTREEKISLPYRNGILHGMDLGYDNYTVAAKSWHFLFVIRDWGLSKQSEETRKQKFVKDSTVPSFRELNNNIMELNRVKKAIKKWQKRKISDEYINSLKELELTNNNLPETIAIQLLQFWMKNNYGCMSKLYWSLFFHNGKPNVKDVREQFVDLQLKSYQITNILDEAAAISVIEFLGDLGNQKKEYIIRMIYEGADGETRSRNLLDGNWRIVFVQEKSRK